MGNRDFQDDILDRYLEKNTSPEPALLKELRLKTEEELSNHHMISGFVQGRYLSLISKILRPQHILEIGTYTGYATLCLAEGLVENGHITTIDNNDKMKDFYFPFFENSRFKNKIKPVIADAITYLENSAEEYDLVFLDANKRQYLDYFELILPKIPSGGVILADNTLWKGKVLQEIDPKDKQTRAIDEFNRHLAEDERVESVLLPLRDGITLIRKK